MKSEIKVREARQALRDIIKVAEEMGMKSFAQTFSVQAFCDLLSWVLDEEDIAV